MIGATAKEWAAGWSRCSAKFPVGTADGLRRNPTLERHRAKSVDIAERRAEAGRKGGLAAQSGSKPSSSDAKASGQAKPQQSSSDAKANVKHPVQSIPLRSNPGQTIPSNGHGEDYRAAAQPSGDGEFNLLKMIYPKRGGSQRWPEARKAINARLAEGHTWAEIHAGAHRYANYIRATGKERTEHTQQAATFVGTNKSFLEPWDLPASKSDVRLSSNLSAAEEFMRRTEPVNETH